ncbi:myb-like protein D [Nylanderia fulva]|nr:myb-like protein D [Nylanderia fulva]
MTILSKSSDTTANSSCNTSILGNLELSDVNLSDVNVSDMNGIDINNFENCGTNLNNNNGEEMIHEVLAENKSTFTSITENTELDSTIVPFCDLNGVKNSSINNDINNNDNKLYCSNSQIENVSQNTDFEKNKISNVSDKDSDYEPSIQSSNDTDIEHTDIEINDDLEIANNESSILANSSENANEKNMLEKE